MLINKEKTKELMKENYQFLLYIFRSSVNEARNIVRGASDKELNVLGLILYWICKGDILLKEIAYDNLKKRRKLSHLRNKFEDFCQIDAFLGQTKHEKERMLLPLATHFKDLLHPLFNL